MLIFCPSCNGALTGSFLQRSSTQNHCAKCSAALRVELFPALFRPRPSIDPALLAGSDGEAECYEHAGKRAVSICHQCGRFVCALCEADVNQKIWCPACLMPKASDGKISDLETGRTLFDSIALAISWLPVLLFFYPIVLVGPAVIFLVIRYWKAPSSLIPRNKWRFLLAILIVLVQAAFLALLVVAFIYSFRQAQAK